MEIEKMILGLLFVLTSLSLAASDTPLPDDELFRLCIDFKKENLPHIKGLIERPEYNINAEVNSQWCGGVTILHATYWFYRWITDDKKREVARPVMKDTVVLFLEHKANPYVMISGCLVNDQTMEAEFQDTINSAFKHVHMASDNEIKKLMLHYYPEDPKYPAVPSVVYYVFPFIFFDAIQEETDKSTILKNKNKFLNIRYKLQAEHSLYKHQTE